MAERSQSQQRGRQLGEAIRSPFRGQSAHPTASAPQSPSPFRAPSAAIGSFISLRRFAPPPPIEPREYVPEPLRVPFDPPSIQIAPIRRMAPQRGTTGRPAREEPLLSPPPPGKRARQSDQTSFLNRQSKHLPLYAGRPREDQDKMLETLVPRPRDITFLPPLTASAFPTASLPSPDKKSIADVPPPTPPKDGASTKEQGTEPPSSTASAGGSSTMLGSSTLPVSNPSAPPAPLADSPTWSSVPKPWKPFRAPVAKMYDGQLGQPAEVHPIDAKTPGGRSYIEDAPESPSKRRKLYEPANNALPSPENLQPRADICPQDPFKSLTPNIKPNKPVVGPHIPLGNISSTQAGMGKQEKYPDCEVWVAKVDRPHRQLQTPFVGNSDGRIPTDANSGRHVSRPQQSAARPAVISGVYHKKVLAPYRPTTPPREWFLTQEAVNEQCRSASMPTMPVNGNQTFAKRSLAEKPFGPVLVKMDFEPLPVETPRAVDKSSTEIPPLRYYFHPTPAFPPPISQKPNSQLSVAPQSVMQQPIPQQHAIQRRVSQQSANQQPLPQQLVPRQTSFQQRVPQQVKVEQPLLTKESTEPVHFIDYTKKPDYQYAKFPAGRGGRILKHELRLTPFGLPEAKAFTLMLRSGLQSVQDKRLPTPQEVRDLADASDVASTWLLAYDVNASPQCTGITYGILLFKAVHSLFLNWFTVAGLPRFIQDQWTMPCTNIKGEALSYQWYLNVQDIFFKNIIEAYNNCLWEKFFLVGDIAYPMNGGFITSPATPENVYVPSQLRDNGGRYFAPAPQAPIRPTSNGDAPCIPDGGYGPGPAIYHPAAFTTLQQPVAEFRHAHRASEEATMTAADCRLHESMTAITARMLGQNQRKSGSGGRPSLGGYDPML